MLEKSDFVSQLLAKQALEAHRKKKEEGRRIVRQALPKMPSFDSPKSSNVLPEFDNESFRDTIIRESIKDNLLTGGRHPKAAPLKTDTSPRDNGGTDLGNSGPKPMNWAEYEEFLNNYGKKEGGSGIRLSGFESNDLPGGIEATLNTKPVVGISQAGASEEADISDQSRSIGVDLTKNRALPRGARQREKFLAQNPNYGQAEVPEIDKGSGISARSRAFLDYDGKGGSLGALRAADASQNLMRYGDKFGVKVGDNDYKEISREGAEAIRGGKRNDREFEQEFLSQYLTTAAKPADSQSEDAKMPKPVTRDLTTMDESYKPGYFPKELGFNVSYNDEAPDMGLDPKLFSYMRFK